jgi:hypothetical protein
MVYLLTGLTKPERRSALRRLRLSARMGHCARLPSGQLALALFADRIRTGIGRAGAVLRLHPAGSTLPVMVLSGGAIAFLLCSTVSIRGRLVRGRLVLLEFAVAAGLVGVLLGAAARARRDAGRVQRRLPARRTAGGLP